MINETIAANVPMIVSIQLPFIDREVRHAGCSKCGLTRLPSAHRMKITAFVRRGAAKLPCRYATIFTAID